MNNMKKKLFLSILVLIMLISFSACNNKNKPVENGNNTNETTKSNGKYMYSYKDLKFDLPKDFEKKDDNKFIINNKELTVMVDIIYSDDVDMVLDDYILSVDKGITKETFETTIINGKSWIKCSGSKGSIFYFIRINGGIYQVKISDVTGGLDKVNETTSVLEKTLDF